MSAMTEARLAEIESSAQHNPQCIPTMVTELTREVRRLRECIAKAPHAYRCEIGNITTPPKCTCWKSKALGEQS